MNCDVAIPQSVDEISTAWLQAALGVTVSRVCLEATDDGTTGRAVITVEYAEATQLPHRFFVKLPPADRQQRAFVRATGMGVREARFYRELAADLPVRVPRCFFSGWDQGGERYIMLLEYLPDAGCTFRNASTRGSPGYLRQVLAALARLHGQYWQAPAFSAGMQWVEPIVQHDITRQLLPLALQKHAAAMPPLFVELAELYLAEEDAIHELWRRGEHTLIHGDIHDGNLFYDTLADAPGLLDWALLAKGPPMRDVGYFLAGTLAPKEQQVGSKQLLDFYRRQLLATGVTAPDLATLQREYAIQAVYPWLGAVVTLAMGDAWQPSRYIMASLQRLHETLQLLGSLDAIKAELG
ncbi:aminoglycoside phosphotransferase family protein [Pseudohalioglobus sediminis]|uniref:Aminoglycoside phosphotransferase family protein n=1 Tax=Pseudohalioglobus sediminis TaxID=2606449 RepID=A0A5B0WN80_9GAMM|nr:aminoglycoside phosphotransferase family protein [Pseudohalioglobus sediminis]KAA1188442.1 aminoglycoside phosphotransferase family protein [Pseudohalioglobus sediminis]